MTKDDNQVIQLGPQTESHPSVIDTTPPFAISLVEAKDRADLLHQFVAEFMKAGVDFGHIPGTDNPTLLKPGAEKLCEIYGFSNFFEIIHRAEDWDLPLFAYIVKVRLVNKRKGLTEAEGVGAANSREGKYSKLDTFSLQNTLLKMAKKRALVDAVLSATRSSGIFTQDIDDLDIPRQAVMPAPIVPPPEQPIPVPKTNIAPTINVVATNSEPQSSKTVIASEPAKRPAAFAMTNRQRSKIMALVNQTKMDSDAVGAMLFKLFGHQNGTKLTKSEASKFIDQLMP